MVEHGEYLGWRIMWTGWKECQEDDTLVGQWIAVKNRQRLYSSVPGGCGRYNLGDEFDVGSRWITTKTPLGEALAAWDAGLGRLRDLIAAEEAKQHNV